MKKQWSGVGKLGKSTLLLVSVCFLSLLILLIYCSTANLHTSCTANGTALSDQTNNGGWLHAFRHNYGCTASKLHVQEEPPLGRDGAGQQAAGNAVDDSPVWSGQPCPSPFNHIYCFNGGECLAEFQDHSLTQFLPFCKCALNYHGRRCEYLFNPELYGFSVAQNEVQTAALSTLVTFLLLGVCALSCCLYLYRRCGKGRETDVMSCSSFPMSTASSVTSLSARQIRRLDYQGVCSL